MCGALAWPAASLPEDQWIHPRAVWAVSQTYSPPAFGFERPLEATLFLSYILVLDVHSLYLSFQLKQGDFSYMVELDFGMPSHPHFVLKDKNLILTPGTCSLHCLEEGKDNW